MAQILWREGISLANLPEAQELHQVYRDYLKQELTQLVNDYQELASKTGGTLWDTCLSMGVVLDDFATLLHLTDQEKQEVLGAGMMERLFLAGII